LIIHATYADLAPYMRILARRLGSNQPILYMLRKTWLHVPDCRHFLAAHCQY